MGGEREEGRKGREERGGREGERRRGRERRGRKRGEGEEGEGEEGEERKRRERRGGRGEKEWRGYLEINLTLSGLQSMLEMGWDASVTFCSNDTEPITPSFRPSSSFFTLLSG